MLSKVGVLMELTHFPCLRLLKRDDFSHRHSHRIIHLQCQSKLTERKVELALSLQWQLSQVRIRAARYLGFCGIFLHSLWQIPLSKRARKASRFWTSPMTLMIAMIWNDKLFSLFPAIALYLLWWKSCSRFALAHSNLARIKGWKDPPTRFLPRDEGGLGWVGFPRSWHFNSYYHSDRSEAILLRKLVSFSKW